MKEKPKFNLTKEQKDELISAIKNYFLKEREETLGELSAGRLLSFFMEELAPEFYNIGVYDAYKYMGERVEDLLSLQK